MNDNNYLVMLTNGKRTEVSADAVTVLKSGDLEFYNFVFDGSEDKDASTDEVFAVAKGKWDYYYKNDKQRNCATNVEGL